MNIKYFSAFVFSAALLVPGGCAPTQSPQPADAITPTLEASDACSSAMQLAAAETGYEESERLLIATLSTCDTAEEWMEQLKTYPGAIGVVDESAVNEDDFVLVCWDHSDTPVCKDAVATGRMPDLEEHRAEERTVDVLFQWVPQEFNTEPAQARYRVTVYPEDGPSDEAYVTPIGATEDMPSMDVDAPFQETFVIPDGSLISASATVYAPPNEGRLTCMIVDWENEEVLDYQEGQVGSTEPIFCQGYTHDNHLYTPGLPPSDFTF